MAVDNVGNVGIQMKQKERTKTFMMISEWKKNILKKEVSASRIKEKHLEEKQALKWLDWHIFWFKSNFTYISHFYSLEVVGRGSETQLQLVKNLNYLT